MGRDRSKRPGAKPVRMFVAVPLSAEITAAIEGALEPWRERLPGARWVRPENRHVTLKFLGPTPGRLRSAVEEACRGAAEESSGFEVSISGMGVFPRASSARVLWVGLDDPGGALAGLAEALQSRLPHEFPPEKRGFSPHLTVARFREPPDVSEWADELAAVRFGTAPMSVDRLVLFKSTLRRSGAVYEALAEFALGV